MKMLIWRHVANRLTVAFLRLFGTRILDRRTGKWGARIFAFAFRGRIHVVGLDEPVQVEWEPQKRLTYWKQCLVFSTVAPPDFEPVKRCEAKPAVDVPDAPRSQGDHG